MKTFAPILALVSILAVASPALAAVVTIEATGTVNDNLVADAEPLSLVAPGETVTLALEVDSENSQSFFDQTRGYVINSFTLRFSGGVQVELLDSQFPAYFSLADGFYFGNDNFFIGGATFEPGKLQLVQEPYRIDLQLSYTGDTIDSVDIMDALGSYGAESLNFFGFRVWDSYLSNPENLVMNFEFDQLMIASRTTTSVELPAAGASLSAGPNPFNPATVVSYTVPRDGLVALTIFDVQGRAVRTLVQDVAAAGRYEVRWDGRSDRGLTLSSGTYFARLDYEGTAISTKLMMLK